MDKGGIDPFVVIHPVVFVNSDWCREQMLNAFIAALLNIIAGCDSVYQKRQSKPDGINVFKWWNLYLHKVMILRLIKYCSG